MIFFVSDTAILGKKILSSSNSSRIYDLPITSSYGAWWEGHAPHLTEEETSSDKADSF